MVFPDSFAGLELLSVDGRSTPNRATTANTDVGPKFFSVQRRYPGPLPIPTLTERLRRFVNMAILERRGELEALTRECPLRRRHKRALGVPLGELY